MSLPFEEKHLNSNIYLRTFFESTDSGEYYWHRDREDRIVISEKNTDWMIQLDDELPKSLNQEVFIPMGVYHRVIKGTGDLQIKLIKIVN